MELHKLLKHQLNRLEITSLEAPDQDKWEKFLDRVNNSYLEHDQERYLLERSMELSSSELLELNERLENAQRVARIGYWVYDKINDKISWSKHFHHLVGLDPSKAMPNYQTMLKTIHPDDLPIFEAYIHNAFEKKENFECEIRFLNAERHYLWYYIIAHILQPNPEKPVLLSGVAMDISKRKASEEQIKELNEQLVSSARRAGMADVATSILHNVGNVLNSANVSARLLEEKSTNNYLKKLFGALDIMKEHKEDLSTFLTNDSKGKLIPEYLLALYTPMATELKQVQEEISSLSKNLDHIKEIIMVQQTVSKVSGMVEKVFLAEAIDTALKMSNSSAFEKKIKIEKKYEVTPFLLTDKAKLLQILVNLIQNAKDALLNDTEKMDKKIILSIQEDPDPHYISISVQDNGVGIAPEHLKKIFAFGFTTKADGHGFGLHSSALAAREMSGSLEVQSSGLGEGAIFILKLPLSKDAPVKKETEKT